jgi:CHAT domain-containing protein/tetratricopeptide (TPR) repeat protein
VPRRLFDEALQKVASLDAEKSLVQANCLMGLARLQSDLGRYDEARNTARRALELRIAVVGDKHPSLLSGWRQLASLALASGRRAEAQEGLEAVERLEAEGGAEADTDEADTARLHAMLEMERGDLRTARAHLERARTVMERSKGDRHPDIATILLSQSRLAGLMGDVRGAETAAREAVALLQGNHASPLVQAQALIALGGCKMRLGERSHAEKAFHQAVEFFDASVGRRHPLTATALLGIASLYATIGAEQTAQSFLSETREIFQSFGEAGETGIAQVDLTQGLLAQRRGDLEGSLRHIEGAFATLRRRLGEEDASTRIAQARVVWALAAVGRFTDALPHLQDLVAHEELLLNEVFQGAAEGERAAYLRLIREHTDQLLTLAVPAARSDPAAPELVVNVVLRRKGLELDARTALLSALDGGGDPSLAGAFQELTELRVRLGARRLAGPGAEGSEKHRRLLEEQEQRAQRLERELTARLPGLRLGEALTAIDGRAVAAALPEGAALLEYVEYEAVPFASPGHSLFEKPSRGRFLSFVLRPEQEAAPSLHDLGAAADVDELVAAFLAALHEKPGTGAPGPRLIEAALQLRQRVLDPMRPELAGCRQLVIALDGQMARVPLEALPGFEAPFLADELSIRYVASGRDLLRRAPAPAAAPGSPLVIAAPDYDLAEPTGRPPATGDVPAVSRRLQERSVVFSPLDGAREEGKQVAGVLGVHPVLGADALESRLRAAGSPRVLHIATHGFFLPEEQPKDPPNVFESVSILNVPGEGNFAIQQRQRQPLILDRDDATALVDRISRLEHSTSPLLRSGLALAGANTFLAGGVLPIAAEDGLMTAADAATLDLRGTELVVLSACETGVGQVEIGEGVLGLRWAFIAAGARAVIASLWQVPDKETVILMVDLHRRMAAGRSAAEALHEAQLALREVRPHPFFWAGFVLHGGG